MSHTKSRRPQKSVDRAQFRDMCARFAAAEIGPRWRAADRDKIFPRDFYVAAAKAGLIGITAPEDIGGSELGAYEEAIAMEEMAKVNPNLAVSVLVQNVAGSILYDYGSPAQRDIVQRHVDEALAAGAKAVTGGAPSGVGTFFEPTVLADVDQSMS